MPLALPSVSILASDEEIARAIESCGLGGIVQLNDVPAAPLSSMQELFDKIYETPEIGTRVNKAYTKNLVYKDSFRCGNGGDTVDMKRVLDLSPDRMEKITEAEPSIHEELGSPLLSSLDFWREAETLQPKILRALSLAIGSDIAQDAAANYRMVDYYQRPASATPPRCTEHRDFGSFTLIFSNLPGLEVWCDGSWTPVAPPPLGSALLLFGWCTQIRSNGRIPAVLHRVVDPPAQQNLVPRRTSAVFFVAPKSVETPLEPVVRDGEVRQYVSGVKVGQLRGSMARKWRHREGTLSAEDRQLEEEEIRATRMLSQDDVVMRTVAA